MDVLADISERTALTSSADLLRLYEKWLRTGSARDGKKLDRSRDRAERVDRKAVHSVALAIAIPSLGTGCADLLNVALNRHAVAESLDESSRDNSRASRTGNGGCGV